MYKFLFVATKPKSKKTKQFSCSKAFQLILAYKNFIICNIQALFFRFLGFKKLLYKLN